MKELLLKQKQVLFFIIAGGLSAIVEIGSFKLFSTSLPKAFPWEYNLYGVKFPLSNVLSTSCGIFTNYFLSIWFVFERGKYSKKKEFMYFMIVSFISTILSLALFQVFYHYVFTSYFSIKIFTFSPEMISKIAAIVTVSVLNYSIKKKVIFNG
ncbi:GtrA family protein [Soonwooa sp.]|uniref:GtrA family protein n=1 Tax=Soonwooa sp. TaxID=1938592 RepID=UPI002614E3D6|nr:GtrA family protein [Soonwooa sp.]